MDFDDGISESSSDDGSPKAPPTTTTRRSSKQQTKSQTTTLPPAPAKGSLAVFPKQVTFDGVKPGLLYALTFSIQNSSKHVKRVRIVPPTTENFALVYEPSGNLAPGLGVTAVSLARIFISPIPRTH